MKKLNLIPAVFVFLAALFFLFSCKKADDEKLPVDPVPINLTGDQVSLLQSENTFAFDIFKNILETARDDENVIMSPLSISSALSMALNGANGATRDSMLQTLRVSGLTPEIINSSYKNLTKALLSVDQRVLISIANSVWAEKNFAVKVPFRNILTEYYNADSKSFDITDQSAYVAINSWIEDKTNGLIKNMLSGLEDNTVMLLINAIYFKGKWGSQFDKNKTVNGSFYKYDGSTAEVPMMKQTSEYKVYSGEGFVLAEFPYGQGNFVMDVIVPDGQNGIKTVLPAINETSFNGWLEQMVTTKTDLSFPRFKFGYQTKLNNILANMGMGIAFTDNADFSNISDMDLLITEVIHKAFIETNEEGTEAAAVTIIGIGTTSEPVTPFTLNIDHSFIYIIRETTTNSILFMGKVADPLSN